MRRFIFASVFIVSALAIVLFSLISPSNAGDKERYNGPSPTVLRLHFANDSTVLLSSVEVTVSDCLQFHVPPLFSWSTEHFSEDKTFSDEWRPARIVTVANTHGCIAHSFPIDSVARIDFNKLLAPTPIDRCGEKDGMVTITLANGRAVSGYTGIFHIVGNEVDGTESSMVIFPESELYEKLLWIEVVRDLESSKRGRRRVYPKTQSRTSAVVHFSDGEIIKISEVQGTTVSLLSSEYAVDYNHYGPVTRVWMPENASDGRPWSESIQRVKDIEFQGIDSEYPGERYAFRVTVNLRDGSKVRGFDDGSLQIMGNDANGGTIHFGQYHFSDSTTPTIARIEIGHN